MWTQIDDEKLSFFNAAVHVLRSKDRRYIVFVLSVCLSVVNFKIRHKVWTAMDIDFIFCMHTPLMILFYKTPRLMTLWPWHWHEG